MSFRYRRTRRSNTWLLVALQEPSLFACSIRDNISYGLPGATQEQIEDAAKMANAHDFILDFPEGYNTMVSGTALSGGQKQRIAIGKLREST